jgi:hypothetical protein
MVTVSNQEKVFEVREKGEQGINSSSWVSPAVGRDRDCSRQFDRARREVIPGTIASCGPGILSAISIVTVRCSNAGNVKSPRYFMVSDVDLRGSRKM